MIHKPIDLIKTGWYLFTRWALIVSIPFIVGALLASCTQPNPKHPMYPVDKVYGMDTCTRTYQIHGISYGNNWGL